jgi:hypothetical protein
MWEETVEQNQRRTPERNLGKRDSAGRDTSRQPRADRGFSGDRPSTAQASTAQESGLLRELKETPRHLD